MATDAKQVHIRDITGHVIFNRLLDDGTLVIRFASGGGFVDRKDVQANKWTVVAGWTVDQMRGN